MTTTPRPYRVICEMSTDRELRYLSEWHPTHEAAQQAETQQRQEGWQSVRLVPPGTVPGTTVTGKQVLAVGARVRRRGGKC